MRALVSGLWGRALVLAGMASLYAQSPQCVKPGYPLYIGDLIHPLSLLTHQTGRKNRSTQFPTVAPSSDAPICLVPVLAPGAQCHTPQLNKYAHLPYYPGLSLAHFSTLPNLEPRANHHKTPTIRLVRALARVLQ